MAFSIKTPPIRLTLSVKDFNLLINILKVNELKDNDLLSKSATKLKDKLMKYSVPRTNDKNEYLIDIRYFTSEASLVIEQLLSYNSNELIDTNYFDILINERKKYLDNKGTNL